MKPQNLKQQTILKGMSDSCSKIKGLKRDFKDINTKNLVQNYIEIYYLMIAIDVIMS